MAELFSLATVPTSPEGLFALSRQLLPICRQDFIIDLYDGHLVMPGEWLMFNIFWWRPLLLRALPVKREHCCWEGLLTKEVIATIQTNIYNDVIATYGGGDDDKLKQDLLMDLTEIIDNLHMMIANQLGEYHVSMSIFEIAELMVDPAIEPLTHLDISKELQISVEAAEIKRQKAGDALLKKLLDSSIPNNVLAPFLELGQLNKIQVTQVLLALGFRTDAADTVIRRPITDSYMGGLGSIVDFAIESMQAKKTVYYNLNAMPTSQYNSRKQQIITSAIRYLYPGDCGTDLTIPFYIHGSDQYARNFLSANIVENGRLITLTDKNLKEYYNRTVHLRNPLACRHTDGICQACGGLQTNFMLQHSVAGVSSTQEVTSPVSQLVLSAKHFTQTKAIPYVVPEQLHDILVVKNNNVYIRDTIDVSNLKIGVMFGDMPHINELMQMTDESTIYEQQFSSINYLRFSTDADVMVTGEVAMLSADTIPYFTSEFLTYIKDNKKLVSVGDTIWIPLKRFDHYTEPLLRSVIEANSMIKFNQKVREFTAKDIRNYTSLPDVLSAFADIVYREISTNILHISVVLKAYLITSENNYNIPVVTDINNVKFGTLSNVIARRSLGAQFAFEDLKGFLADPATYTLPHPEGIYDDFFYSREPV